MQKIHKKSNRKQQATDSLLFFASNTHHSLIQCMENVSLHGVSVYLPPFSLLVLTHPFSVFYFVIVIIYNKFGNKTKWNRIQTWMFLRQFNVNATWHFLTRQTDAPWAGEQTNTGTLKAETHTLRRQFELISRFPGLMSRCRMLAECRYFRPTKDAHMSRICIQTCSNLENDQNCVTHWLRIKPRFLISQTFILHSKWRFRRHILRHYGS